MTDSPSFDELYEKHKEAVFRLALRMVRRPADAEDLVQQAFIRAYRKFDDFRGESEFATWIYRIAMNLCADFVRSRKRAPAEAPLDAEPEEGLSLQETVAEGAPTQETRLIQEETAGAVREAVAGLKEKYREVLILRDMEGMSYEAIAQLLGISEDAVGVRLIRARNQLKSRLQKIL